MYVHVYISNKQKYTYVQTHIYVYSCILLLTNLQLSKENIELLNSVKLFHYPVMKKNFGFKVKMNSACVTSQADYFLYRGKK